MEATSVLCSCGAVPLRCVVQQGTAALLQAALDKVKELGSSPRLAPGDYGDLVRAMKKILQKDSIIPVAAAAAEAAATLASGLRDAFSSHAKARLRVRQCACK